MVIFSSVSDLEKYRCKHNFLIVRSLLYDIEGVRHYPSLSPSKNLFLKMKNPNLEFSREDYFKEFENEINRPAFEMAIYDLIDSLYDKGDILLMCYCKEPNFCHRFLVYKKLKSMGYECVLH